MTISHTQLKWEEQTVSGENCISTTDIHIHPLNNGVIIINVPGVGGGCDGYQSKYVKLADFLIQNSLGAVVRMGDPYNPFGWDRNLRQVMAYVLDNSEKICQSEKPNIYLMGTSAGAGAVSLLAWEYPEVKRMLLLEPAAPSDRSNLKDALGRYTGEIVVVTGSPGISLGKDVGQIFTDFCTNTTKRELVELTDCDHHFSGEKNGRILSQAPLYAFSKIRPTVFPNNEGGVVLYK